MNKAVDLPAVVEEEDNEICNPSDNRPFYDVLRANLKRRDVLSGSLATAATSFFGLGGGLVAGDVKAQTSSLINFTPVPVADGNGPVPVVSEDYEYEVLIPWGDPIEPSGPAYSYPPSARNQARQVGIGHDGMWFFPLAEDLDALDGLTPAQDFFIRWVRVNSRGMLCVNHEFGTNPHVLGKASPESLADVRTSQHAHGVSVIQIELKNGSWTPVESKNSRRIHVNTPVEFSGPVADSELLMTPNGNIPLGTVNNCGNGYTPWGTYLTCEENFNGYFGATNEETTWVPTAEQQRYGFSENGFGYGWHMYDKRFDLSDPDYQNEENRFGWMVEIDPNDATARPVKRTALGRCKHEGGAVTIGEGGRAVIYMGDDQRFDYIYKFVSSGNYQEMLAAGTSPFDEGILYVARFNEDGTGDWLELSIDNPDVAAVYSSNEEVLTYARVAADAAGATPMDRPEWTSIAPDGMVYCTLTNNSRREVADAANPLAPNADGHIIRWMDADNHVGTSFAWEIFLIAQDTHGTEESFSDPDGLWIDRDGRVFIETDGGQKDGLNNQLLVADPNTKEIRRLFTGTTGCEITGIAVTPAGNTMFINIQHPGNGDPTQTNFPAAQDGATIPRDCTIVLRRKDNGVIGS